MLHNVPLIMRTGEPTKLDTAEFGTLCKVTNTTGVIFYIQLSNDSENPRWTFVDCEDEEEACIRATELMPEWIKRERAEYKECMKVLEDISKVNPELLNPELKEDNNELD